MLAVTTLTRNRSWALPDFFARLAALDVDPAHTALVVIDDNSDDPATLETLYGLDAQFAHWRGVVIYWSDAPGGAPSSSRDATDREQVFSHLAELRNVMIDLIRSFDEPVTEQLSIDSDVLVTPRLYRQLASHGRDMVGSMLHTQRGAMTVDEPRPRHCNFGNLTSCCHYATPPSGLGQLVPVMVTGACALHSARVLGSPARFGPHPLGEDVAYCLRLLADGIQPYADTIPCAVHVMAEEDLDAARALADRLDNPAALDKLSRLRYIY